MTDKHHDLPQLVSRRGQGGVGVELWPWRRWEVCQADVRRVLLLVEAGARSPSIEGHVVIDHATHLDTEAGLLKDVPTMGGRQDPVACRHGAAEARGVRCTRLRRPQEALTTAG